MCRIPEKIAISRAIAASARRAEWEMDHLLKKSSPRFFRSLSLRKSSQISILMTRNRRESCGSLSFLPSFEQPKWQRFLANIRHWALRQKSELNPDRIFVRRDRNQAAVLLFCMLQQENQHPRGICFQVVFFFFFLFLFFCFCCKLHLVCFQERTQLTFSCDQERSGG